MKLGLLSASSLVYLAINRVVDKEAVHVDSLSLSVPADTTDSLSLTHDVVLQSLDLMETVQAKFKLRVFSLT